jgi:hypothetical protein
VLPNEWQWQDQEKMSKKSEAAIILAMMVITAAFGSILSFICPDIVSCFLDRIMFQA